MSQVNRLLQILEDGKPHSSFDLAREIYNSDGPSLARLGARVWDVKKKGYAIRSWKDKDNPKKHWYQLAPSAGSSATRNVPLAPVVSPQNELKQAELISIPRSHFTPETW